jgi:hypothetical protein
MRKVLLLLAVLCVVFYTGQVLALTVTFDSVLDEWVGDEVNNLGTEPAPDGGSYTLLAVWDGANFSIGMDRDSSDRYLGDTWWENDSFFVAIDTDGVEGSGSSLDGYSRMSFGGPMLPDVIYYFAGGNNIGQDDWYESSTWNGTGWDWNGWTNFGTMYGTNDAAPDDEISVDIVAKAPAVSGANELLVWTWMTREGNDFVEASWPRGHTGFEEPIMDVPLKVRDLVTRLSMPHDPSPSLYEEGIEVEDPYVTLSWAVARDPNGVVDPNLVEHKLYMTNGTDPNLVYVDTVSGWEGGTLRASYTLSAALLRDAQYLWRVDEVLNTAAEVEGDIWSFYTELSVPVITAGPDYQVVEAGATAKFTVTVSSLSPETYQWYKYVDGVSDIELADAGDISGSQTYTLSIANVELADEEAYYCIVNNDSGIEAVSDQALLGVKRRIAYWPFEGADANSIVAGSPVSVFYGDPEFVTTGIVGDAMAFDADTDAQDLLYTNPDEVSYFDICNYTMTVSCWINSTAASTWGPMVARNGEDGEGWQLRHNGNTLDRICFTTRGTGNDDGTASNRTVYDGNWHYAVGTYDGTVKKVYIDGVLSRVYSADDGSIAFESDAVDGLIASTGSPVAMAGRVKGNIGSGLIFENWTVTACTLDEVSIYNYVLDADTIAQTYADITGTDVCPDPSTPVYDLDGDCIVNLNDFVMIASEWLIDTSVKPTI